MSFTIIADPKVDAAFRKMWQKDSVRFGQIEKKLIELEENPETGKPLKKPLRGLWRLHIGHYVLIYKIDRKTRKLLLWIMLTTMRYTKNVLLKTARSQQILKGIFV